MTAENSEEIRRDFSPNSSMLNFYFVLFFLLIFFMRQEFAVKISAHEIMRYYLDRLTPGGREEVSSFA